ncbi:MULTISPECIES: RNA polymerase sigma factor [Butyricimonas]|uniref:RNA polymerase sigma factor n=1 Tax=Butyricimonas TaxID=574697 RepID=UPI0007FB4A33|nr:MULTISPECIES: RNA polymerase sigma-70 factor [Butyricimonas]
MSDELYTVKWLNENYPVHFEVLYKSMYKRLYILARNFLMDEELADDVIQDVFMGLWNKGKNMPGDIPLERYLFTSVRNLCVDHHRKLNIVDKYQKHLVESEAFVYFPYEEKETEREIKVKKLLSELPDMQRQVLELSVMEGLKYKEVAERLNIAEGTVHTHIKRAYKYIKTHLLFLLLFLYVIFK